HGFAIESSLPLDLPHHAADGRPSLIVRARPELPAIEGPVRWTSAVTSYRVHGEGMSRNWLVRDGGGLFITPDEILVPPHPPRPERMEYLFTSALALWLHVIACPPLHAAAVRLNGAAIGLMARSGGGKSTLAAALVLRGARMLCDDVLPLRFD